MSVACTGTVFVRIAVRYTYTLYTILEEAYIGRDCSDLDYGVALTARFYDAR